MIPTVQSIRATRRFQDRRRAKAARVITAMSRGLSLHLTFSKRGSDFSLSNGTPVSTETALMVVNDVRVCSVNDGLFPTTPQTWRFIDR
jgi:hypothetical protein